MLEVRSFSSECSLLGCCHGKPMWSPVSSWGLTSACTPSWTPWVITHPDNALFKLLNYATVTVRYQSLQPEIVSGITFRLSRHLVDVDSRQTQSGLRRMTGSVSHKRVWDDDSAKWSSTTKPLFWPPLSLMVSKNVKLVKGQQQQKIHIFEVVSVSQVWNHCKQQWGLLFWGAASLISEWTIIWLIGK